MKKLLLSVFALLLTFYANAQNASLFENFESGNVNDNVSITDWQNIATEGTRYFIYKQYNSNTYAQATAYNSTDNSNVIWLITPSIKATSTTSLSFKTAYGYYKHDPAYVAVSTNFTTDPTAATWTELNYAKPTGNPSGYTDLQQGGSGNIDLSNYNGQTIYIAFRYTGNASNSETTTWQVDDISITGIAGLDFILSSNKISVYPNPATDYIVVNTFEKGKIQVFNSIGIKMLESENTTIDVRNLQSGLYFVTMENEGQKYVAKFLKK